MRDKPLSRARGNRALAEALDEAGLDIRACFQCGRCSSGCPVAPFMDVLPMEMIRLSAMGQEDVLLDSHTIWLCASCQTCSTRCPNAIDIAGVSDHLRERALAQGRRPAEPQVAAFHHSFLRSVRRWGRTYELGMLGFYKLRARDLFGDLGLGLAMIRRGKLHLFPRRSRAKRQVRRMFQKRRTLVSRTPGGENP